MSKNFPLSGFETTIITKGEGSDALAKSLIEKVTSIATQFGGELITSEDWGKRRMAYPIEKESRAQYTYVVYTGKGGVVAEVERNLRITDNVLRFLTVNVAKEFDAEAFKKRRAELQAAAKRREEEREARREERAAERKAQFAEQNEMGDFGPAGDAGASDN